MTLPETHMRIRAHEDEKTRVLFHQFVTDHFGGEYRRAVWFADECRAMAEAVREAPTLYSVKQGYMAFHPRS